MTAPDQDRIDDVLLSASAEVAAASGITGVPHAAVLTFLLMDEDGQEIMGRAFVGSATTAIGLMARALNRLHSDAEPGDQ